MQLPEGFSELEPWVDRLGAGHPRRAVRRAAGPAVRRTGRVLRCHRPARRAGHRLSRRAATSTRCPDEATRLLHLLYSMILVSYAVNIFKQNRIPGLRCRVLRDGRRTNPVVTRVSTLPLSGLRVVDAATLAAGPLVATALGEFGADVIKVEQPGTGDPLRTWGARRRRRRLGLEEREPQQEMRHRRPPHRRRPRAVARAARRSATCWCSTPGRAHWRVGAWTTSRCTHGTRSWWCCT